MEDQISQIGLSGKKGRFNFFTFLIQVLVLSALIYGGWWIYSSGIWHFFVGEPPQAEQPKDEIDNLMDKVSDHIILPSHERPALATVIDASKLKQEDSFYKNAENGDKLLIWSNQRVAIIYSPSRDLLVNMGPVLFSGTMSVPQGKKETTSSAPQVQVVEAPTSTEPLKIQILNGSGVSGAASKLGKEIESDMVKIISTGNAKNTYETLIIVNLTGKNVSVLKDKLGVEPTNTLPSGEISDKSADVLILIGKK